MRFEIVVERFRPVREHDGVAALVGREVAAVTHPVPQFLRDEREEGVEQTQGVRQSEINHREFVRAARVGFRVPRSAFRVSERRLARLDVPVAILAPEETVERGSHFTEFVFGEGDVDFTDRLVELEQNPLVVARE